jgi:RimJ/RimL family protein N-acetyltransferase
VFGATILRTVLNLTDPNDGRPVKLRHAAPSDMPIVYEWQCHPETRRFSRDPRAPSLEEHTRWFKTRLESNDCVLTIILHDSDPAGVLRFDRRVHGPPEVWEISILVAPDKKGRGISAIALALGRQLMPSVELIAEVLTGNDASHRLFRNAGYELRSDGFYHLPPK